MNLVGQYLLLCCSLAINKNPPVSVFGILIAIFDAIEKEERLMITIDFETLMKIFSYNQNQLAEWLQIVLNDYSLDAYGNIYSIKFRKEPVFVAHLDTLCSDMDLSMPLILENGILMREKNAILGADGRAGVWAILENIDNVNFIFTRDSLFKQKGAKALINDENFLNKVEYYDISAFIQLNRRGNRDIIGVYNGYCNEELSNIVKNILKDLDYREIVGGVCDLRYFSEIRGGVNLSIGYYNSNSEGEYLKMDDFWRIVAKIPKLKQIGVGESEMV